MSAHAPATRVRLSIRRERGRGIAGAWWPRTGRLTTELPDLVATLTAILGDITAINVNWPPLQAPPDYNLPGWQHRHTHLITVTGQHRLSLLVLAPTTNAPVTSHVKRAAASVMEMADVRLPLAPVLALELKPLRITNRRNVTRVITKWRLNHAATHEKSVWEQEDIAKRAKIDIESSLVNR